MTAHVRRSFLSWLSPKKTWEWVDDEAFRKFMSLHRR